MAKHFKRRLKHILNREDKPRNPTAQAKEENTQQNSAVHDGLSVSSQIIENSTQSGQTPQPQDLWKAAYEKLDERQRPTLWTEQISPRPDKSENPRDIIDEVIETTKEEYEKHCQTASGKFKQTAHKIINAALSFKDIIGAAAALDPTQHAASAWTIVSLGLTMAKSHSDLRDAMFESSEYLADILTYCSFVEKNFYRNKSTDAKTRYVENSLIRLHKAILCYVAQVQKWQKANTGRKVLDTLTFDAASKNPLTALKESVKTEKDELHKYIGLAQYLRHNEDTAKVLSKIDELANAIDQALDIFKAEQLHAVDGALYDSFDNRHMETCLPNTRTELIRQVSEWIESDGKLIFWINGMAGTGKSTISQTIAHICKERGSLGATFFFKKTETDRSNARYLIPTIMKQLVTTRPELAAAILESLKNNENIGKKNLHEQFTKLLLEPLKTMTSSRLTTVIVIDALDECDGDEDLRLIMRRLFELEEVTSIHLRVFLTSRPELRIRLGFSANDNHQDLILHEIPQNQIEHDIRVFLRHKLGEIQRDRSLPSDWLASNHQEMLVQMAVPLFIIAATACRWISEGTHPRQRLERLLKARSTGQSQMDQIYLPILQRSLGTGNDELELESLMKEFKTIIGTIILLVTPLSIESLALLLKIDCEEISETLAHLHSVLYIKDDQEPVRILHLSFRDYLLNTQTPFRIDEQATHGELALYCLDCMNSRLKRNICRLPSYGIQREDIDSQTIETHLTADLQYACRYWVHHLWHSDGRVSTAEALYFLKKHFLHWWEVLALIPGKTKAIEMIDILKSLYTRKYEDSELSSFLQDAGRFALQNFYMAKVKPLQIYYAGLLFAPKASIIRDTFSSEMPTRIRQLSMEDSWTPNLHTLEGHTAETISIALSPDGHTLASTACGDTGVILWDTATGEQLQKVECDYYWRTSIAFSPDGLMLASVCRKTIILWETASMKELRRLSYGDCMFQTLSFSPDGKTLASGTANGSIILWSMTTNEPQILHGHHRTVVTSFSFSPSEQVLASGSFDENVILWDTATCEQQQKLSGHFSQVVSVAFSPDGLSLVSGSMNGRIILWDIATRKKLQPLPRYFNGGLGSSVAFDPVTGLLATGHIDSTIFLWDIATGTKLQTLVGHSEPIVSLAFSSDGRILASGSKDRTIKLWDVATCKQQQHGRNEERDSSLFSMAFSTDGCMLALGLTDGTLKLWKKATGKQQTLIRHWKHGIPLAFSPDGSMLASTGGSTLSEIILWDTATGEQRHKLSNDSFGNRVTALAFSPNGSTLAWSGEGIVLWDTKTGKRRRTIDCDSLVYHLAFSPDGHTLAAGLGDASETIQLWDTDTGERQQQTLTCHPFREVHSMVFSPDGRTVAVNFFDGTLQLWDTATDTPQILNAHSGSALSVDKTYVITDISISDSWVSFKGERVLWLRAENSLFVSQTSIGSMLALGYHDNTVAIFDFQQ